MESASGSLLTGALDIQANAVATILAGGTQGQSLAAQPAASDDSAARAAGLRAQGIGQNVDTTC